MTMTLSTQHLRGVFKEKMDYLIAAANQAMPLEEVYSEIQTISVQWEQLIDEKTRLLQKDFNDHTLTGEYLNSVTETFDDLDQLLRVSKTFTDAVSGKTHEELIENIKKHHIQTLVPLLNILSKLENDYISLANQAIHRKEENLIQIQHKLEKLKREEIYTKNSILSFNKKKKLAEIFKKIKFLDLKRQILKLTIHHDKLNLYYFNNDHPIELKEIKQRADSLRSALSKLNEVNEVNHV